MGDLHRTGDPEFDAIARALREAYVAPPAEAVESEHLAAMAEAARVVADQRVPIRSRSENQGRRTPAIPLKEALMTRIRTAALAAKLAALTLVAALATGGLAAAGVISLPDALPGGASDRANAVHDEIDGSDPSEERCGFGLSVAEAASDGEGDRPSTEEACEGENAGAGAQGDAKSNGKSDEARARDDVGTQEHGGGAHPEEGAGRAFGDSVSDDATGGVPRDGGGKQFGESVSGDAKELVPRPTPQTEGGQETGESFSEEGRQIGESKSQQGQDLGTTHGQAPER